MISYFTKWNSLGTKSWNSCSRDVHALPWMPCFVELESSWNSWKFVGKKQRSIWHPGFSTAAFKQVAKSQGGIGGDYTGGCGDPAIITSWHPLSVKKCIYPIGILRSNSCLEIVRLLHQLASPWTQISPREVSPCLCPMAAIPRNDIGESGGGERWRFFERQKMEMLAQDIPHTLRKR